MPRVTISFDPETSTYNFGMSDRELYEEYEVVIDIKSSTHKRFLRNIERVRQDQEILKKLFIEAQMAGRSIRER